MFRLLLGLLIFIKHSSAQLNSNDVYLLHLAQQLNQYVCDPMIKSTEAYHCMHKNRSIVRFSDLSAGSTIYALVLLGNASMMDDENVIGNQLNNTLKLNEVQFCPTGFYQTNINTTILNWYRNIHDGFELPYSKWKERPVYAPETNKLVEGDVYFTLIGSSFESNFVRSYYLFGTNRFNDRPRNRFVLSACTKLHQNQYVVDAGSRFAKRDECLPIAKGMECKINFYGFKEYLRTRFCTKKTPHQYCRDPRLDPQIQDVKVCESGYTCINGTRYTSATLPNASPPLEVGDGGDGDNTLSNSRILLNNVTPTIIIIIALPISILVLYFIIVTYQLAN